MIKLSATKVTAPDFSAVGYWVEAGGEFWIDNFCECYASDYSASDFDPQSIKAVQDAAARLSYGEFLQIEVQDAAPTATFYQLRVAAPVSVGQLVVINGQRHTFGVVMKVNGDGYHDIIGTNTYDNLPDLAAVHLQANVPHCLNG